MKKLMFIGLFIFALGLKGFSQFAFGVAPGLSTNNAYFGFKAGKVVPYVGFQMAHVGFQQDYSDRYYDGVDWVDDESNLKGGGNIYAPTVGIKFFAIEKNNLKAYLNLSVAKPMIRGKIEFDGTEVEEISDELKKVKLLGGEFGFGVEYFFDSNFSVGGEFGLRYLGGNYEDVYDYVYNGEPAKETNSYKAMMTPTYSKIALNFYFGGE